MSVNINYKTKNLGMSNRAFGILLSCGLDVSKRNATTEELQFVARMEEYTQQLPYIDLEKEMPSLSERKFWSRVFFDTARTIFERKIGSHEHSYWQAQAIYVAYRAGIFFQEVVQDKERGWEPNIVDKRDYDRIVNAIER